MLGIMAVLSDMANTKSTSTPYNYAECTNI